MMTVTELQLPTNFGLGDLYESNNNNASFVLDSGERFGASSLMLGFHSPVLKEKYIKAGILDIDAVEFSHETVKSFVEAMYCGKLHITRENFRDVNKICHVFNVTWLSRICLRFFEQAFKGPDHELPVSDENTGILFQEAMYFCEHGHSVSLLVICRRKMGQETFIRFTRTYLETRSNLPNATLESLMSFTNDHSIFLSIICKKNSKMNPLLDNVSKFLLFNINLVNYFDEHAGLIAEIFDILLENEEATDWRIINKLYRRVTKEYTISSYSGKRCCSTESTIGNKKLKINPGTILSEKTLDLGQKWTVIQGNIAHMNSEAIVNSTNSDWNMDGSVGNAIRVVAGNGYLQEVSVIAALHGALKPSQAVMSPGYLVSANHVIHVNGPQHGDGGRLQLRALEQTIHNALTLADVAKLTSIAFPSVFYGWNGFLTQNAATLILKAVSRYFLNATKDSTISQVYFVLSDQESVDVYTNEINKISDN